MCACAKCSNQCFRAPVRTIAAECIHITLGTRCSVKTAKCLFAKSAGKICRRAGFHHWALQMTCGPGMRPTAWQSIQGHRHGSNLREPMHHNDVHDNGGSVCHIQDQEAKAAALGSAHGPASIWGPWQRTDISTVFGRLVSGLERPCWCSQCRRTLEAAAAGQWAWLRGPRTTQDEQERGDYGRGGEEPDPPGCCEKRGAEQRAYYFERRGFTNPWSIETNI